MFLNKLESIYNWINKLNPTVKTLIIIILTSFIVGNLVKTDSQELVEDISEYQYQEKKDAENYTILVASEINSYVDEILNRDLCASNVLLLNYHNSVTSTNGLSYRYLTALTEKKRGFDTKSCIRVWKELEYLNYEDEIKKINRNGYLELGDIYEGKEHFPKLVELLELSGAKAAGIYPIIGINGPIGAIIIIHKHTIDYDKLGYYKRTVAPFIQPLSTLLDYDSVRNKMKKEKK
jgi:hypothetical protein